MSLTADLKLFLLRLFGAASSLTPLRAVVVMFVFIILGLMLTVGILVQDDRWRENPGAPGKTLATFCSDDFCRQVIPLDDEINLGDFMRGLESCSLVFGKIENSANVKAIGEQLMSEGFEAIDEDGAGRIFFKLRSNHLFEESKPVQLMGIYDVGLKPVLTWKVFQRMDGPRELTTVLIDDQRNCFLAANVKGQLIFGMNATSIEIHD